MNKIYAVRILVLAIILTSASASVGHQAFAQQHESNIDKDIYWMTARSDIVVSARKSLRAGKLEQARRLYIKSLKSTLRKSDRITALNDFCALHNIEKQYEKALGFCNKALKLAPDNWRSFNNRGAAYFGLGNYDQAQQDFAKALSLNPGDRQLVLNKQLAQSKTNTE